MSDYPRPPEPPLPPRFLLDRVVAGLYSLLLVGNFVWWTFRMLRRYQISTLLEGSLGFVVTYVLSTFFLLWLLTLVANGQRGGFIGVGLLLSLVLAGAAYISNVSAILYDFPLWAYCVARLFGLLGPRLWSVR